jgi:dihydrofolate reductase
MHQVTVCAIVAMDENRVIGIDNQLPWHIPEDLKRFKELTTGKAVIMGRKTYESLPEKFRPLPNRKNFVITRSTTMIHPEVQLVNDPLKFLKDIKSGTLVFDYKELWVVGGQEVYSLLLPMTDKIFLTKVKGVHAGDAFFPKFEDSFKLVSREDYEQFSFEEYINHS